MSAARARPPRLRLRLFVADEYKPLRLVSPWLWAAAVLALAGQLLFHHYIVPPPAANAVNHQKPPSQNVFRLLALGEPAVWAKILVMRLQAFDNQPGISIPFNQLDYDNLGLWLDRAVGLDGRAEYPHFLMAKVYSGVADEPRQRKSAAWVERHFLERPRERWEWMAHVANMMRHTLKDEAEALRMAGVLRANTRAGEVPGWAREMEIFFLENQDEFSAAAAMLQSQLEAGEVSEPQEFVFLSDRLRGMLEKMAERGELTRADLIARSQKIEKLTNDFLAQFDEVAPPQEKP